MITMNASEFKAKCLALLDRVAATGETLVILKHGKPVANLVPAQHPEPPQHALKGSVKILGDVIAPAVEATDWEAEGSE